MNKNKNSWEIWKKLTKNIKNNPDSIFFTEVDIFDIIQVISVPENIRLSNGFDYNKL